MNDTTLWNSGKTARQACYSVPFLHIQGIFFIHGEILEYIYQFKMESIRKLSNQWTKTLYQNNLKFIAFFFTLFKSYRRN